MKIDEKAKQTQLDRNSPEHKLLWKMICNALHYNDQEWFKCNQENASSDSGKFQMPFLRCCDYLGIDPRHFRAPEKFSKLRETFG